MTPREKYLKAWREWRSWERLIDCVAKHDQSLLEYVLSNVPSDPYGLNDAYWGRWDNEYKSDKVGTRRANLFWLRDNRDFDIYMARLSMNSD